MKTTLFKNRLRLLPTAYCYCLLLLLAVSSCNDGYDPWVDPDALDNTGSTSTDVERYTGHPPGVPRLRGGNVYSYDFSQALLDTLVSWNVNHLRWNMNFSDMDPTNMTVYMSRVRQECDILKRWLPQLEQHGIYISFCMEITPGGRHPETNQTLVCTEQKYEDGFVEAWSVIASELVGQKAVWAYELSNEPQIASNLVGDGLLAWMPLCRKVSKAIRTKDPETAIIIAAANFAGDEAEFESFDPDDVPNVIYTDHMYETGLFTHLYIWEDMEEMSYPSGTYNKEHLRDFMEKRMNSVSKKHYMHVYIGEFGVVRWAKGADLWLRDVIEIMEELGYDWANFNFCLGGETKRHLTVFSAIHGTNVNYMEYSEYERTPQFYEMLRWFKLNKH